MKTISGYEKQIRKALKDTRRYNQALEMQIHSLATAMRTLAMASRDIDGLEQTFVYEETKTGTKPIPHPAFRIQRDAQDSVTRQMKALKLTVADLDGGGENDPLYEMTGDMKRISENPLILRPDDDDD